MSVGEVQGSVYERPDSWSLWRGGADSELRHTYSSLWSREFIKIAHTASSVAPEPQPAFLAKQTGSKSDLTTHWCSSQIPNAEKRYTIILIFKIKKWLQCVCIIFFKLLYITELRHHKTVIIFTSEQIVFLLKTVKNQKLVRLVFYFFFDQILLDINNIFGNLILYNFI